MGLLAKDLADGEAELIVLNRTIEALDAEVEKLKIRRRALKWILSCASDRDYTITENGDLPT